MFTWKQAQQARQTLAMADAFTTEERAHLETLRARYEDTRDCGEFGLDEQWLLYVRWLVEHKRIGEGIKARF